jgi:hypothetical protein
MISKDNQKKIDAAYKLLTEEEISFKTVDNIRKLVAGIYPKLDKNIDSCIKHIKTLKKIDSGDLAGISPDAVKKLPEKTEKDKKRKKVLLLFFTSLKDLRKDLESIIGTFSENGSAENAPKQSGLTPGKIFKFFKGPLGLLSLGAFTAAFLFNWLNNNSVNVLINNNGCNPITPAVSLPVKIPGIKLPTETIPDGGSATAVLPPLFLTVDNSQRQLVVLRVLGVNLDFQLLGDGIDLVFDGESLLNRQTAINLGDNNSHILDVNCDLAS